jgi:phage shock protein A
MPFTTQNDADTVDPESLYDEAAEEIGNLEQKLALSNASNEMATEEIKHLKSMIEDQSQEIDGLKKERMMERDHFFKRLKSMMQDQSEEIDRLKWKLAKLNK